MALDISWLSEGLPLMAFALAFVLFYAILAKTKILGENKGINFLISLLLSVIFVSFSGVRTYVMNITPWFIVLVTCLFFILLMLAFATKDFEKFTKPLAIVFLILLILIAIIALFYTFPSSQAILPGADENNASSMLLNLKHFLLQEKMLSAFLLLAIAIIAGIILTR